MKTAFVFPGQGAQKVGMGRELYDNYDIARDTFAEADEALGENISNLILEGPQDKLTLTANTQPAIVTVSLAALRAFQTHLNISPDFLAGHSLGEFSALVAAGALSFSDTIRITRARGEFMQNAVPAGEGAMAAVMKKKPEEVYAACKQASQDQVVSPANFNSPGQIVISGNKDAVSRASAILKESGGRVIPLKVSAPFHCELMSQAARNLDDFLGDISFKSPTPSIITNVEAEPNNNASRIRSLLVKQVTSPVRWTDSIRYMISQGVTTFVEFGPGTVLAGLISKIDNSVQVASVNSKEGLDKAAEALDKANQ